ncbi:MAG: DUF3290 domain-containing protein [Levilactobacillus sp.]|jgi:hypothetical protein|uniref:DUF3290 domain-containing protein n=1 Tax=Levilactobacillus suantsaiihabitans TaxID=2487722 RepID=A0A4Z0J8R2_9LACO|nr:MULTISPECIES: DUF3290 domain-containing protein [Levilactobacillus]MCH4124156.1 DUF3290 domain-containing protein [Levilactobacillus sp.]MCI1554559.1 DUF3290 domain-containing protein [Levilactobacillus sp.]MCI1598400.1 DUF3290 domain-containing protein [Levilactobacillus sp.]TGD17710.1 DUF3290 domain-containing protein [Levilactobacillus suantsaiihabitans]
MTFYTYGYLTNHHSNWQYLRIALIIALLAVFIGLFITYLRHSWNVKYKDMSIITGTLLLLVLGFQINSLVSLRSATEQTSEITGIVKNVAKQLDVQPSKLAVNATTTNNNLLIKAPSGYYRLAYNADGSAYVVERVQLQRPKVTIVKE